MVSREEDRLSLSLKESQLKVQQLESEMSRLRKQRDDLHQRFKAKLEQDGKREKQIKQIKEEYDGELRRVIGEYKKVALGNLQKLKLAEHALKEGSMSEEDVLTIPLSNPHNVSIRRVSTSSNTSMDQGQGGQGGQESGDDEVRNYDYYDLCYIPSEDIENLLLHLHERGTYFHCSLSVFLCVCLSVCLSVCVSGTSCEQNSSQTDEPIWTRFSLNGCFPHWLRSY